MASSKRGFASRKPTGEPREPQTPTARPRTLHEQALDLLGQARAASNFTGAASLLRLLNDLEPSSRVDDDARLLVQQCTDHELARLDDLIDGLAAWEHDVRERLGLPQTEFSMSLIDRATWADQGRYTLTPVERPTPIVEQKPDPDELVTLQTVNGPVQVRRGDIKTIDQLIAEAK